MLIANSDTPDFPRPRARQRTRLPETALRLGRATIQTWPYAHLDTAGRRADDWGAVYHQGLYDVQADAEEERVRRGTSG